MADITNAVRDYLASNMSSVTIRREGWTSSPSTQMLVQCVTGTASIRSGTTEERIAILSRSEQADTAKTNLATAYGLLHNQGSILSGGGVVAQLIKSLQIPYLVGQDDNSRYVYRTEFFVRSDGL